MERKERESVLASIWAEDTQVGMVCFKKAGKIYTPLASWRSNLNNFDFGFIEILENWETEHGLNQVLMNLPQNYTGHYKQHPVFSLISVKAEIQKQPMEIFEGLAYLHKGLKDKTIDFSTYPKERFLEQVKRLDANRDPVVLAFLQGISSKSGSGLVMG